MNLIGGGHSLKVQIIWVLGSLLSVLHQSQQLFTVCMSVCRAVSIDWLSMQCYGCNGKGGGPFQGISLLVPCQLAVMELICVALRCSGPSQTAFTEAMTC